MSDNRVTRSAHRSPAAVTDRGPQIRVCAVTGTYHTKLAQILALRSSQRAPYGPLTASASATSPQAPATGKAPTVRLSPPDRAAQKTTSLAAVPTTPGNVRQQRSTNPRHLTIAEVCEDLGVTRSTFYDWRAKRKAPPCLKLPNGDLRIRRSEYENWLASLEEEAA